MRRSLKLVTFVIGASVATVAPNADATDGSCRRTATGPAVTIAASSDAAPLNGEAVRSRVTVCQRRTGRRRILARGLLRSSGASARGRALTGAASGRDRLAYVEVRVGPGTDRIVVTVLSARTLRVLRRVTAAGARDLRTADPQIVLADDGTLAVGAAPIGIVVARPGRRARRLARGYVEGLTIEDGVTLRWDTRDATRRYLDLSRPPVRDGCPRRASFRQEVRTQRLTVSRSGSLRQSAIRVCDRSTGRDPVIASSVEQSEGNFDSVGIVGASGTRVLLSAARFERSDGCVGASVTVLDGVTGTTLRSAVADCGLVPPGVVPIVIAPSDAAAWVSPTRTGERLAAISGRELVEIDAGPRGSITDLRGTATGVAWRSGGMDRAAALP